MVAVILNKRFWDKVEKGPECWEWRACTTNGYGRYRTGTHSSGLAHRLVAAQCLGVSSIPSEVVVRHACDNPGCVNPEHLEIGTHADNVADKMDRGRHPRVSVPGERHGMSTLTEEQVLLIRRLRAAGATGTSLAATFGVSRTHITRIVTGRAWKHI